MIKIKYSCCNRIPSYEITYEVAGTKKSYQVCKKCNNLECFQKFVFEKEEIRND
jgi:hypothetical protein